MRTSITHPLSIDSFALASGRVGMTLCPGRKGPSQSGPDWHRDLDADILALKRWGTDILVSLTRSDEMQAIGVGDIAAGLREAGILWLNLPITDAKIPDSGWHDAWRRVAPVLHQRLEAGGRIVIHCRAGLERTALVAALLQCERGERLADALAVIARARHNARAKQDQRQWLETLLAEHDRERRMIRASLYGGAIGDALGAEIEFWPLSRIRARFPRGVDEILPHAARPAAITDDTQMTLFVAEGLIQSAIRGGASGLHAPAATIHHALLRWLATQNERVMPIIDTAGLIRDPRLHHRRAPGNTCLSALRASRDVGAFARNDSKGCGAIMRVAPIGLFGGRALGELADDTSHLTHAHPTGRDAARACAHLIAELLAGAPLGAALAHLHSLRFDPATTAAIDAACTAPLDASPETVESLGGGWTGEEALSIALYATRCATGFEHGLRIAVTHSGDSDSTGAIAGNLLGLVFPDEVMSHPWRRQIECADLIDRLAADLYAARTAFAA